MKKEIILYSLSTAINRGSVLLFFPFLTQLLSLADFGKWSLVIIVSNLLIPIIALNGSSGILREGSENLKIGFEILKKFIILTALIGMAMGFLAYYMHLQSWIFYSIIIATSEGLFTLALTYLRVEEKSSSYFLIILFKTITLFLVVLYAVDQNFSLDELLLYHFSVVACYAVALIFYLYFKNYSMSFELDFKPILLFSVALIPHGLSQWIMSSSDRVVLEYMLSSESVGIYSLAYNLALVLMLLNSGIALAIPTYMIKNYRHWLDEGFDNRLISYYTFLSIALFAVVLILYGLDMKYFHILKYYGDEMLPLIGLIYLSIFILGLYYFYANYLFYHKKAGVISMITFKAACLNVVLTIGFVYLIGVIGAALSTLFAYIYYLRSIRKAALSVDINISIVLIKPILIFTISCGLIYIGVYYVL